MTRETVAGRMTRAWRAAGACRRVTLRALTLASLLSALTVPALAQDAEGPVAVTLRTAMGDIDLELYPDRAPITVANFLAYLDAGHYNGGSFYRVVRYDNDNGSPKIEVIQGGVRDEGRGRALPPIAHESTQDTGLRHVDGAISMGRGAWAPRPPSSSSASATSRVSTTASHATPTCRGSRSLARSCAEWTWYGPSTASRPPPLRTTSTRGAKSSQSRSGSWRRCGGELPADDAAGMRLRR